MTVAELLNKCDLPLVEIHTFGMCLTASKEIISTHFEYMGQDVKFYDKSKYKLNIYI